MADDCDPSYSVTFYDRGGQIIPSPDRIATLSWGRNLDAVSRARITYTITSDDCCANLGYLEAVVHECAIRRNDDLVWYGWLQQPEYSKGSVEIPCVDALWWLNKRVIHKDIKWNNTDLSDIFNDIWEEVIVNTDNIRAFTTITQSGTKETREVLATTNRTGWSVTQEMLDTGLDITVVGQNVFGGIPFNEAPRQIKLSDMQGNPSVLKDGEQFATRVIVDANQDIQATYPEGPGWSGSDYYPLVEEVVRDSQIQDVQSALNAAKARYEYTRTVPRVINLRDGLTLSPSTTLTFDDLIPGRRVIVDTDGLCYNTKEEFRIGVVDVDVAGGIETIRLGLQPKGPAGGLANIEDPLV